MFNSTRRQSQHMKKKGFQRGNEQSAAGHDARWGEREVSDAGEPAPAPRKPFHPPSVALITPLHRGALETAPAAGTAAPDVAMATDASDTTAPRPAPPAPPAGKPRARGRSDEAGPSNVDSMDQDDEHRGGLSEIAPEKRRRAIACDAPPGAAQVARARAAALPPDVAHRCARARPHARTTCRRLRCGAGRCDCL